MVFLCVGMTVTCPQLSASRQGVVTLIAWFADYIEVGVVARCQQVLNRMCTIRHG